MTFFNTKRVRPQANYCIVELQSRALFFPIGGDDRSFNDRRQIEVQHIRDPQQSFQTWRPEIPLDKADHGAGQTGSPGHQGHGEIQFHTFLS